MYNRLAALLKTLLSGPPVYEHLYKLKGRTVAITPYYYWARGVGRGGVMKFFFSLDKKIYYIKYTSASIVALRATKFTRKRGKVSIWLFPRHESF